MNTLRNYIYVLAGAVMLLQLSAKPIQKEIDIILGSKYFADGDAIRIDSVKSTSEKMEIGDTVNIEGMYRLDSKSEAQLGLYLTQTRGDGLSETDKNQTLHAKEGWHKFSLSITVKHEGFLHLTFYDNKTRKPFGGVYFSSPEHSDLVKKMPVKHYIGKL